MAVYAFWNNKGGTGKTSLSFQVICHYAERFPSKKILAIDVCPQANLSELFLGGLMGKGSETLFNLHQNQGPKRVSIGGYFQDSPPPQLCWGNRKDENKSLSNYLLPDEEGRLFLVPEARKIV